MKSKHPDVDSELMDILKLILKFNPNHRASINELLSLPIFDHIRREENEMPSYKKIDLPVDNMPLNPATGKYEEYTSKKIKEYLTKQVQRFQQMVSMPSSVQGSDKQQD